MQLGLHVQLYAAKGPVVLCGDLNLTRGSVLLESIRRAGRLNYLAPDKSTQAMIDKRISTFHAAEQFISSNQFGFQAGVSIFDCQSRS